jgi:hypothetical protein
MLFWHVPHLVLGGDEEADEVLAECRKVIAINLDVL